MIKQSPFIIALLTALFITSSAADEPFQKIGPSTGLPIPRYISLGSNEANMRRGPSSDYPVDWVYHREGFPLRVIGESGHWRKVEDADGIKGWFHYALLSGNRTALILTDRVEARQAAAENAQISMILEKGVIAPLKACTPNWCRVEIERIEGWLPKSAIWGVNPDEVFED